MAEIKTRFPVALGNGSRPPEFSFAEVEFAEGKGVFDLYQEVRSKKTLDDLESAAVILSEGVTFEEFLNVLRNGNICYLSETGVPLPEVVTETKPEEPIVWQEIEISKSELDTATQKKLSTGGLVTFGDIQSHFDENEGFDAALKLTDKQQQTVIESIAAYAVE